MKFVAAIVFTSVAAVSAYAGGKSAPDLPKNSYALVDCIVQFKPMKNSQNNGEFNGNVNQVGGWGHVSNTYTNALQGVRMKLPAAFIPIMQNLPFISYISPVRKMKGTLDISTSAVNANMVWSYG